MRPALAKAGPAGGRLAPLWTVPWLLAVFVFLAGLYSVVTPPFETPDEIWHYAFIQHLASQRELPVSAPNTQEMWRQQGVQAPDYYLAAALLTAPIDQSDFPQIFQRANPHRAIGRPDTPINRNYLIHHPDAEGFPWQGAVLALHIARLFSVLLGAVTVYATYRALALFLPGGQALLGAGFIAFLPQFVFISASASNDNAINAAAALVLWRLLRLLRGGSETPASPFQLFLLGLLLGLALLAKLSGLGLVGVAGLAIVWRAWRDRRPRLILDAAVWTGLPALLIAGWWYLRNWQLYGDLLAWNVWEANILLRVVPAGLSTILSELESLERSFWGLFGWLNLPYPGWVYGGFRLLEITLAIGLLLSLFRATRRLIRRRAQQPPPAFSLPLLPFAFLALWLLVLALSWLRFMRVAPAAQGRYFFAAAPALALLWVLGWRGFGRTGLGIGSGVTVGLGLLTAVTPFWLIRPAYTPPPMPIARPAETLATFGGEPASGGPQIELVGASASPGSIRPGQAARVQLALRARQPLAQDWSLFIHLVDEAGLTLAQLDTMPGGGLRPTSRWPQGGVLFESYAVPIPVTAYTPNQAQWRVGFYNHRTGTRLPRLDGRASPPADSYRFGRVEILPLPHPADVPNPVDVAFGDNISLLGYRFSSRQPTPGQELTVSLYWTATGPVAQPYTAFAHLLTADFQMHGGVDLPPTPPTVEWQPGAVVETHHRFVVSPDAPPGRYQVEVGLYTGPDFRRLRLLAADGAEGADRLLLGPLRIAPPP